MQIYSHFNFDLLIWIIVNLNDVHNYEKYICKL